ncbi:4-amino-4-deoxychorismate lyase [Legionella impletisoli]|uniref:Aminodeoxychorismate lyase n=2 Tax=Legionella impletisoli TaxID=343510 RepID=A0A917JW67_9GAMM|nr:4-amino-4-deoxychorismate lyase [Legionella impletisoli]
MPTKIIHKHSKAAMHRMMLGEGLFETIRIEQSKPCYASSHWQRMHQTASVLKIPFEMSQDTWNEHLHRSILEADLEDGGIKVVLMSGRGARELSAEATDSSLIFHAFSLSAKPNALTLMSAPWVRDAHNPIYQFKSINYLESIQAQRLAKAERVDDVLFFNTQGYATETTVANLFMIHNNILYTPSIQCGLMPGIIRARIIDLALDCNMGLIEGFISHSLLLSANALFVTNALRRLIPVRTWGGQSYDVNHPTIQKLRLLITSDTNRFMSS